jgi:hypothetical protein
MSLELSEREIAALRAEYCKGFTDEQAETCFTFCRLRGLLPGKHVLFQLRRSKEWDEFARAKVEVTKIVFITTIDASRLIAQRTGQYAGQAPEQYIYLDENGAPSIISEIPLPQTPLPPKGTQALPREPWAVRTTVFRKDFPQPISSVARFDAYAATYKTQEGIQLTEMWVKRGPEQLAKCSEMLSLRRAFPEELGGLYIAEEFKADAEEVQPPAVTPASVVPLPPVVPKVDQTPATGTDTPRPGEHSNAPHTATGEAKAVFVADKVPATLPEHSGDTLVVTDKRLGPIPPVNEELKKALAAVPDLKPASEIPAPKKKGGRPKQKSPENGQTLPPVEGITDADIASAGTPAPVDDTDPKIAQEFVESVTSFTREQAASQGLPEPPDPLPDTDQKSKFIARMRALVSPGVDIKSLGDYTLTLSGRTGSKYLTVGDWTKAFEKLDAAKAAGTLKELVHSVPEPEKEF